MIQKASVQALQDDKAQFEASQNLIDKEREEEKNAALETERHSHWWVWVDEHGSAIPKGDGDVTSR